MASFCRYCGSPVRENASFCPACGKPLSNTPAQSGMSARQPADPASRAPVRTPAPETSRTPAHAASPRTARRDPAQTPPRSTSRRATQASQRTTGSHTAQTPPRSTSQRMAQAEAAARELANTVVVKASAASGETAFGVFENGFGAAQSAAESVAGPIAALFSGVFSLIGGAFGLLLGRNKKALSAAGLISLLWVFLELLRRRGIDALPAQILSFLTFAKGGMDRDVWGMLGGLLGKGTVAAALASLFAGGGAAMGSGFKRLFAGRNFKFANIGPWLMGLGASLCLYVAFVGEGDALSGAMAALSGLLVSAGALGGNGGILQRLVRSFTSRWAGKVRVGQPGRAGAMLSGLGLGFVLGVPLLLTQGASLSWKIGAGIIALGIILSLAGRGAAKRAAACAALVLMLGSMVSPALVTPARAFSKDGRSDTLYMVIDGSEKTNDFSISYNVTSGHELYDFAWAFNSYAGWDAWLDAKAGDTVTIAYTLHYRQDSDYTKYSNQRVWLFAKATSYTDDWDSVETELADESLSTSDGSTGTLEFTLPKDSDSAYCWIKTSYDWTYSVPGGDQTSGSSEFSLNVHINVSGKEETPGAVAEVTQHADPNPGETSTEIPPEIVEKPEPGKKPAESGKPTGGKTARTPSAGVKTGLSVGSAIVGAGTAGATVTEKSKGGDEEKKKKRFRMYVFKNFGDAIRKGGRPMRVYARIAEISEGKEWDRPDLTEKISVSSQTLEARVEGMENSYLCAAVSAARDAAAAEGTLTFTFSGEGGFFRNNIVFRLVDGPQIKFPRDTADGMWDFNADESTVQMVAGGGGSERLRFVFMDAVEEPTGIRFLRSDGFDIRAEKDARLAYTYYACIENHTRPANKESGVFADAETRQITIEAVFPDEAIARGVFTIELYPQGLSVLITGGPNPLRSESQGVRKVLKNGWMEVISYATREKDALTLDPLIPSTDFNPCYADVRPDGTALIAMQPQTFSFQKMEATDESTKNILAKYRYDLRWYLNGFSLTPGDSIPEMGSEYYVLLPIRASAEGFTEQAEIPVRLLGEPFDPRKTWNDEFKGLCKTAIRYFPGDVAHRYVKYIKENFSDPELWDASELRMMRYDVIRAAQNHWTREYASEMRLIDTYDLTERIFKKPPRFIADMAFKIVAKYYWGEHENWITPCKDLIVDTVDEAIWNYAYSGSAKVDIQEKLMEQATNTLENYISVSGSAGAVIAREEQKKLFFVLTAYILADWFKNYSGMEPKDFWESWRKTWFDMTAMALKKLVGAGLEQAMSSAAVNKFFNSKLMQKVNDYLPGVAKGKFTKPGLPGAKSFEAGGNVDMSLIRDDKVFKAIHNKSGKEMFVLLEDMSYAGYREVVQTLLEELFGKGIVWLTENAEETVRDNAPEHSGLTFPFQPSWLGLDSDYEDLRVGLDVRRFFLSDAGLGSKGFDYLFESLFGSAASLVHRLRTPDDPAKEVLKSDGSI